jgi:vancomycin permeability regulator SanA
VPATLVGIAVAAGAAAAGATWLAIARAARRAQRDPARPAEAIVVFGAALWKGSPTPLLRARLDRAAELYARGLAPLVVCSGGADEAAAMAAALESAGVPRQAIALDEHGLDTRRTLEGVAAREPPLRHVLAVSSGYHSLRIAREARLHGIEAVPCAAGPTPTKGPLRRRIREQSREVPAVWWYLFRGLARTHRGRASHVRGGPLTLHEQRESGDAGIAGPRS